MISPETVAPTRLSASPLWRLQREYFARVGIDVWRSNACPSYVTTNPFIAEAYARLVHAHVADAGPRGGPVYVLELGAGAGRFAHHFLESFHALPAVGPPVRYVLSDVARANVDFWREHPKLRAWVERGLLDVVQLGAGTIEGDLRLEVSGLPLRPAEGGRLVAIANYVFDTIEQDAFVVQDGVLWEGHVSLSRAAPTASPTAAPGDAAPGAPGAPGAGRVAGPAAAGGPESQGWLEGLELVPHYRHVPGPAYADPLWTRILEDHSVLPDGAFLFPVGALEALARLRELSRGELLVISADKGFVRLADLAQQPFPVLVKHGSFSLQVNYHAIGEWVRASGGVALEPPAFSSIAVVAYAFGAAKDGLALRAAYQREVVDFGPDDFYQVRRSTEPRADELDVDAIIALLRVSRWDTHVFLACYSRLLAIHATAGRDQRRALREGLLRLWARYLPIGEEVDIAFQVGCVLASLGFHDDAIPLFRSSLDSHGDDPQALENLERCLSLRGGV